MEVISGLAFVLLIVGITSIFDLDVSEIWHRFWHQSKTKNRYNLKDEISIMSGETPRGFFKKQNYEAALVLKATGRETQFHTLKIVSLIAAVIGIVIAVLLNNLFLVPVFGVAFWLIPHFYILSTASIHKQKLAEELETSLSIITSSYKSTENIIQSVKMNIDLLNPPVKAYFILFLNEVESIDPNVISALNRLKMRIPNAIFHGWINTLMQCQADRTMIRCLDSFVERFSDLRGVQSEMETAMASAKVTVYMMAALCVGCIPGFYFLNREWYDALVGTMPGKLSVAVAIAIILFSLWSVHKLSDPVELRGDEL